MYDLTKADEIYEELKKEGILVDETFKLFKERMPEQYCKLMQMIKYGCHIYDEELYEKAVACFEWASNRGKGAKWDVATIVKLSDIDFEKVDFYEYDFAYIMNMLYSDYCEIITDASYYIRMTKIYLTDPDYPGKADERAYHNAMKRIEYCEKD